MTKNNKAQSIDQTLQETAVAIDRLRASYRADPTKFGKQASKIEDRLTSIQGQIDSLSEKMLAYKLRRLADSKMLATVSAYANSDDISALPNVTATRDTADKMRAKNTSRSKKSDRSPPASAMYASTTFQCKSDLDTCLACSKSALDRALCYALFIRCATKG